MLLHRTTMVLGITVILNSVGRFSCHTRDIAVSFLFTRENLTTCIAKSVN